MDLLLAWVKSQHPNGKAPHGWRKFGTSGGITNHKDSVFLPQKDQVGEWLGSRKQTCLGNSLAPATLLSSLPVRFQAEKMIVNAHALLSKRAVDDKMRVHFKDAFGGYPGDAAGGGGAVGATQPHIGGGGHADDGTGTSSGTSSISGRCGNEYW